MGVTDRFGYTVIVMTSIAMTIRKDHMYVLEAKDLDGNITDTVMLTETVVKRLAAFYTGLQNETPCGDGACYAEHADETDDHRHDNCAECVRHRMVK